jgi:hypothetical protein
MLEVHGTEYLGNGRFGGQKTKEVHAFVPFFAFSMQGAFRLITSLNLVAELDAPIGASIVVMTAREMLTFWGKTESRLDSKIC